MPTHYKIVLSYPIYLNDGKLLIPAGPSIISAEALAEIEESDEASKVLSKEPTEA